MDALEAAGSFSRSTAAAAAEGPSLPSPAQATLVAAFAAAAAARPDAPAVVFGGVSCDYRELDRRARSLERRLRLAGVKRGDRAAIFLERSTDLVAAVLAVLRCGAAYVPVDPGYPEERIRLMLEDCGAAAVATSASLAARLSAATAPAVIVDAPAPDGPDATGDGPEPADLAYLLYTSGSTGKPKGVGVEHRNVVNILESFRREPGFDSSVVWLAVTTFSFDIAGMELFMPLTTGGRLILASREEALDGKALARLIEEHAATVLQATPSTWRLLLDAGWKAPPGFKALCGGETVPRPLAEEILARGARLWNAYGPTETTIWSTLDEVASGEGPLSVGRPVGNTVVRILDEDRRPLPAGETGEVCIGGAGVARGYWNRPELTADRFIADPAGGAGDRLYRTGDRGFLLPDGRLRLLGRNDDQVKIRGLRVELGEVEAALAAHPSISAAAAAVRDDGKGPRLAAYWVARGGAAVSAQELREFLARSLPPHMVPGAFTAMNALPLTPNGKIDRRALPAPSAPCERREDAETPLQRKIRHVWEEVLGLSAVGLDEDFFTLGGHSLLAVQMLAMVEKAVGRRPPLSALYGKPTVASLAEALGDGKRSPEEFIRLGPAAGAEPFFFLHGDPSGGGLYCRALSTAMPDRPFYALAPHDLSGFGEIPTIEELARRHLRMVRAARPHGPYRLGGYWIEAVVAWEMAHQLEAEGERVASLVLFDVPADDRWWALARRASGLAGGLLRVDQAALLRGFSLCGQAGEMLSRLRHRGWTAAFAAALGRASRRIEQTKSFAAALPHVPDLTRSLLWAWAGYRPAAYRGPATFLETTDVYIAGRPIDSGLRRRAPAAKHVFLKDNDKTMMTAKAAELGALIDRCLRDSDSAT